MNIRDIKDSSEEEDTHNISAFTKFDESIVVRNAEEIKSPVIRRPSAKRRNSRTLSSDNSTLDVNSPRGKLNFNRRYIIKNVLYMEKNSNLKKYKLLIIHFLFFPKFLLS